MDATKGIHLEPDQFAFTNICQLAYPNTQPNLADLDARVFKTTADLLGMRAAPTRPRIVCARVRGDKNAGELLDPAAVGQPSVSRHPGTLCRGRVPARRRTGPHMLCRIENEQVHRLRLAPMRQPNRTMTDMPSAGASR